MFPDLSGIELSNQDLTGIDLHDADMLHATFAKAKMSNADLRNAKLNRANLNNASLIGADFTGADLRHAKLRGADLRKACLVHADLSDCDLTEADLSEADLADAKLISCSLQGTSFAWAKMNKADLGISTFYLADLQGADFTDAMLFETSFIATDLSGVLGLETCRHLAASVIDHRSLQISGLLPLPFLRGIGLPERLIEYIPSIFGQAIQRYSCFISYSTKDQEFADRLHADLQNTGVRCWFAPRDMPIGEDIRDQIDFAIRLRDKLLLVLSENSIESRWVKEEVAKGLEEEHTRGQAVLFPVRLDESFKETRQPWAATLRARHIGDFTRWKEHDEYQKSFARVLRDLTVKKDR